MRHGSDKGEEKSQEEALCIHSGPSLLPVIYLQMLCHSQFKIWRHCRERDGTNPVFPNKTIPSSDIHSHPSETNTGTRDFCRCSYPRFMLEQQGFLQVTGIQPWHHPERRLVTDVTFHHSSNTAQRLPCLTLGYQCSGAVSSQDSILCLDDHFLIKNEQQQKIDLIFTPRTNQCTPKIMPFNLLLTHSEILRKGNSINWVPLLAKLFVWVVECNVLCVYIFFSLVRRKKVQRESLDSL